MKIVRPLLRGLPIIIVCMAIAISLGAVQVYYAVPIFQAGASIKINDKFSGASEFLKEFQPFSQTDMLKTEVEVIMSRYMIQKAVEAMGDTVLYFRYIRGNKRELYNSTPFLISNISGTENARNRSYNLTLADDGTLTCTYLKDEIPISFQGKMGETLKGPEISFSVCPNEAYVSQNPTSLRPDNYAFEWWSADQRAATYAGGLGTNLLVKMLDPEISIVKIYALHEVPQKAADFANALAQAYLDDFVQSRTMSANQALGFIDDQINDIRAELKAAEEALERFKTNQEVMNLTMSTESELKTMANLERQLMELELQQTELQNLSEYVTADKWGAEALSDFESMNDRTFSEAIYKIHEQKNQLKTLLQKYTELHPKVIGLKAEIERTHQSLIEGIQNSLNTNREKMAQLTGELQQSKGQMSQLPGVERNLLILERTFRTKEQAYNFLMEKRTEAAISSASAISFHKILEHASVPRDAKRPQKTFILAVAGMVGLIIGLAIVFFINYMKAAVVTVADIEDHLQLRVLGTIGHVPEDLFYVHQDFINLTAKIELLHASRLISIASCERNVGKTLIGSNLAKAMSSMGKRVLLIDADLYHPKVHKPFGLPHFTGLNQVIKKGIAVENAIQASPFDNLDFLSTGDFIGEIPTSVLLDRKLPTMLDELQQVYDIIIVICPVMQGTHDAISLMKKSPLNLVIARADKTGFGSLKDVERTVEDFQVPQTYIVFNTNRLQKEERSYYIEPGQLPRIGKGSRRKFVMQKIKLLFTK
ncbi:MAG: GNVR domain-containing protein [Bacteroidota bacterium]